MLEEEGRVTGVDGEFAFVTAQPSSACSGCSQKGTCHTAAGSGEMIIKALNEAKASVGDRVVVVVSSATFMKATTVLYLVPVAALILGAMAGRHVAKSMGFGTESELISAFSGMAALSLSFLVVKKAGQRIGESRSDQARIVKVV